MLSNIYIKQPRRVALPDLQAGYAVIFLYRKGSIQPFTKGLPSAQLLDILTDVLTDESASTGGIHEPDEARVILQTAVRKARECNERGTLLRIPYITLFEYLQVSVGHHKQQCLLLLSFLLLCLFVQAHQLTIICLPAVSEMHISMSEALWQAGCIFPGCSSFRFFSALETDGELCPIPYLTGCPRA